MVQLTKKMILSRARANNLNGVKTLNCWGNELTDVAILKEVPNVEVINASVNEIKHLEAFSSCHNLRELYLRRNKISSIDELCHLSALKNLKFVWLSGNPFCDSLSTDEYRQAVIKVLPQLQKLDNNVITSNELQKALQSSLESHESIENETVTTNNAKDDLNKPNTPYSDFCVAPSSQNSSVKNNVSSTCLKPDSSLVVESGDFFHVSSSENSIVCSKPSIVADDEGQYTLDETNKIRQELGLQPISLEKYNLSIKPQNQETPVPRKQKRHKKHTGGNNILKATLYLIEELDIVSLLTLQEAVQERLETVADKTSKEFVAS